LLSIGIDFDLEDARLGPPPLLALFNLFGKIFLFHISNPFGNFGSPAKSKRTDASCQDARRNQKSVRGRMRSDGAAQFQALRCNVRWRAVREAPRAARGLTRR